MTTLFRVQYWNERVPNPTPRNGDTTLQESRTDLECFLQPTDAARTLALHDWGIAAGLRAGAVTGTAEIKVTTGTALDSAGHVVVLGEGGRAIVDPQANPTGVQNLATVPVGRDGVSLDTAGMAAGSYALTVAWREAEAVEAGLLVLWQAPWVRLMPDDPAIGADGRQLVLALVELDADGLVTGLEPGRRRLAAVVTGRVALSVTGTDPAAGQRRAAELTATADGGAALNLIAPDRSTRPALSVSAVDAGVTVDRLRVTRDVFVDGRVGVRTTAPDFELQVNGTVCATTFCNPSDLRLKTDVTELTGVLDRLAGMDAVTFQPIGAAPGRHAGVIAQQVVERFPELVVPMGDDGLLAVDYAGLAGVLVGAVNELRAANAALTSRLTELEERAGDGCR